MSSIDAVVYSYKNKNLKLVVDTLLKNTRSDLKVFVFDQNPINRLDIFSDKRIVYKHIIWDIIHSPCEYKADTIYCEAKSEYVLVMSDDVLVSKDWDVQLIDFIKDKTAIVSGAGTLELFLKDKNFISTNYKKSEEFSISRYIDRNFIFSRLKVWDNVSYPHYLKYNGEEEILSVNFFKANVDIYSSPSKIYSRLNNETLKNKYVPFSVNHNYNKAIEALSSEDGRKLLSINGIDANEIQPLAYPNDDVLYNPYSLKFQGVDARKFISNTKVIY